jgi:hypothetical protein
MLVPDTVQQETNMRLVIDDSTRFFTVVGAPYIPERHFDVGSDLDPSSLLHTVNRSTIPSQTGSTGWWLCDDC